MKFWKSEKLWPLLAGAALLASSCNDITKPKTFGDDKYDLSNGSSGSSGSQSSSFKFNFALGETVVGVHRVSLQAAANTKSGLVSACNLAGTGCVCDFLDSSGSLLSTTASTEITYDTTANYYTCVYSGGSWASVAKVRLRTISSSVKSSDITVDTSVTLAQLLGTDLDANKVRTVSRYTCDFKFLQKTGTTTTYFDCSTQAVKCGAADLCELRVTFPYFLYSDYLSNNYSQQGIDKIYSGTGGSNLTCGLQIKEYDCTTSTVTKQLGLYASQSGYFDTSVSLGSGPDQTSASYGFAAAYNTTTSRCPPGLSARALWTATIDTTLLSPSHNMTTGLVATEVNTPAALGGAVADINVDQYDGGTCTTATATCTPEPGNFTGHAKTTSYASGATYFCVIPSALLP